MRLVQGQVGSVVADHASRSDQGDGESRPGRRHARIRGDDEDEKDRRRRDRGRGRRLKEIGEAIGTVRRYRVAGC